MPERRKRVGAGKAALFPTLPTETTFLSRISIVLFASVLLWLGRASADRVEFGDYFRRELDRGGFEILTKMIK